MARQVEFGKLAVGADALAFLRHADVRLVDEQRRDLALAITAVGQWNGRGGAQICPTN